tara:strand:+ start:285 stop:1841 length:1557 start_codon:yes stop_codon:yes gene_type:complete
MVLLALLLGATRGPFYVLGHVDPAYQYLFSSLAILDLTPPRHTDHPGTTLQTLGAIVIAIKWGWASLHATVESLQTHVLMNAESYIKAINHFLIGLIGFSMFFAGRRLLKHTQSWLAMAVMQITPLFFIQTIISFYNNSPEPLLIAVVFALIYSLIPCLSPLKPPTDTEQRRFAILLGIIFGFGLATKVTFYPLLLCVFLLPGIRNRAVTAGVTLLSFIFFTLPILPRYKFMVKWNIAVLKHSDQYGGGDVGLPTVNKLVENTFYLIDKAPMYFILLAVFCVAYIHLRFGQQVPSDRKSRVQRLTGLGLVCMVTQLLITIKHPLDRYLLPTMVFSGFISASLVYYYTKEVLAYQKLAAANRAIVTSVAVAVALTGPTAWGHMKEVVHNRKVARAIIDLTQKDHCIPMGSYISVYKNFAYWFADNWNAKRLGPTLQAMNPDALFYEPANDTFSNFAQPITRAEVQTILNDGKCIYLQTTRKDLFDKKLVLEEVPREGLAAELPLYELKGFQNERQLEKS